MKREIIVLGLAVAMLGSCTSDITEEAVNTGGRTELSVVLEETRTHLGDKDETSGAYKVYWSNGDCINICGHESNTLSGIEEGTGSATFYVDKVINPPYDVIYPASAYSDGDAVLPSVQQYAEESFAEGSAVLVGRGETSAVELKNACGFVKIRLTRGTADDCNISYVKFYGNSDEAVSGRFGIDYAQAQLLLPETAASDEDKSITLECGDGAALSSEELSFVFAVPAQTFAAGFTVEVVDVEGHRMTRSSDREQIVNAGEILAMPAMEFVPTDTVVDVEIKTAEDMLALAEAVAAGRMGGNYYLANDIDMASVVDWPGIGNEDLVNAFGGTFDGRGFAIKNLRSSKPIFNYTAEGAVLKNVVIDASCEFTNEASYTEKYSFGALVGMNRADITDCTNNATVTFTATGSAELYVGGLIGRSYRQGAISGCKNSGTVTVSAKADGMSVAAGGVVGTFDRSIEEDTATLSDCSNTGTVTNTSDTRTICVGGVVGRSTNGTCVIENCVNEGKVVSNSKAVNALQANRYNYIGGVAGQSAGNITGCTNRGTVENGSMFYESRVGGVCGTVFTGYKIENCTNEAAGVVTTSAERNSDAIAEVVINQEHCGGVIGQSEGSIVGCTNHAAVNFGSSPVSANIGGVCGFVRRENSTLQNNVNDGDISITGTVTNNSVGGLYGSFGKAQNVTDAVSTNSGNITSVAIDNNGGYLRCGGIVGFAYPGTVISTVKNTGSINADLASKFYYYAVGGIMGSAECGVSGVTNEGAIMLNNVSPITSGSDIYAGGICGWNSKGDGNVYENCVNSGGVGISTVDNNCVQLPAFLGGILGFSGRSVAIRGCDNYGYVNANGSSTGKSNGTFCAVGGIVGAINNVAGEVSDCHVTANTRNYIYNNTAEATNPNHENMTHCGGIIGSAAGADASNRITVTDCSTDGVIESRRSGAAGIAGFAKWTDISNCSFAGSVVGNGPHFGAGVVGSLFDGNVSDCTVKAENIYAHSGFYDSCSVAGIAANATGTSAISRCKVFVTLIQNEAMKTTSVDNLLGMGMIAGTTSTGTTITDCGFGGALYTGTSDTPNTLILQIGTDNFGQAVIGDRYDEPIGTHTLSDGYASSISGCYYWDGTEE